jgi:Tol biopolymer transport system component
MVFVGLMCMGLGGCGYLVDDNSPIHSSRAALPAGDLAYLTPHCYPTTSSNVRLLALPDKTSATVLSDPRNDSDLAWSPDGQMLGMLSSYWGDKPALRVVDLPTQSVRLELPGYFNEFAWDVDAASLYYLDRDGYLYHYDLATQESTLVADGVGSFSISPDGKGLGLAKRNPALNDAFTFRVLDLDRQRIIAPDHGDLGYLGSTSPVWSPTANEVAVIFGIGAAQQSKLVVYTVHEDHLRVKAAVIARETYKHDYGEDLISVEFGVLAWSLDGEKLLVTRSISDAHPGGELLSFDADLTDYRRLPFDNVTELAWMPDGQWLAYVTPTHRGGDRVPCAGFLGGEIWLADMETLETQIVVTDTMYLARPVWRP